MPLPSIKECPHCGREYYPKNNTQSTCGSRDCRVEQTRRNALVRSFEEKKKIADNARRESAKDKKHIDTFRSMTFGRMERDDWYLCCERCWKTYTFCGALEIHHIVYRSELRGNPKRNDKRNLIAVCRECHEEFHKHKKSRQDLVDSRKLYELFPDVVKKSD